MRVLIALMLLAAAAHADTIEFKVLSQGTLEKRLRLANRKVEVRYQRLKELFAETGCVQLREQPVKGSKQPNLICPVQGNGASAGKIIVGAHFDSAGGDGVIDNWTGAILLPSLAEFIRDKSRRHAFEFVGFAAEERGLVGSRAYLAALTEEQRKEIVAVVTMDSLGLSPTKVWPDSSYPQLMGMAVALARAMNLDFQGVNISNIGTTDSATFHAKKIPVLSLHSITQQIWRLINSSRDVWASVSWKDYYDSHRFVSALLIYLDQKLP